MSAIFSENGSLLSYFAVDGSYGDADGMVIVDTVDWTNEMWDMIGECDDYSRGYLAELFDNGATPAEAEGILEKNNDSGSPFIEAYTDLDRYRKENA